MNGLVCAGKKIHEILLDVGNVGVRDITAKYVQECQLMSDLRHPNITQFHWKKCSTKNMLITLKTDKYLLEISSMHLTQVQYDLDIDYTTLVLRHAYFFKDKCTFLRLYKSKL